MVTARNWLADKNLAKRDGRGRFSTPAKEALTEAIKTGIQFDDWNADGRVMPPPTGGKRGRKPKLVKRVQEDGTVALVAKPKTSQKLAPEPKTKDQLREGFTFWGVDRGTLIAFRTCFACNCSTSMCTHEIPILPSWLDSKPGLLVRP